MSVTYRQIIEALNKWERRLTAAPIDGQVVECMHYAIFSDGSGHVQISWRDLPDTAGMTTEEARHARLLACIEPGDETLIEFVDEEGLEEILRGKGLL